MWTLTRARARPAAQTKRLTFVESLAKAGREFAEDQCLSRAAVLAYMTILNLVPVLALAMTAFAWVTPREDIEARVREILSAHLLPGSIETVTEYLLQFTHRLSTVSILGGLAFLGTAVYLFHVIEHTFNEIWQVRARRSFPEKFVTYWGLITLTPVIISLSIYLTNRAPVLPWLERLVTVQVVKWALPPFFPLFLNWIAFYLLYDLLPHTRVRIGAALRGALVAGTAWEAAKIGFDVYVRYFASYGTLYGPLAVVPVFLVWLYLTWVVVLFGAEVAFVHQFPHRHKIRGGMMGSFLIREYFGLRFVLEAAVRQVEGRKPASPEELRYAVDAPEGLTREILGRLCEVGILFHQEERREQVVLQRAPDNVTVGEIVGALGGSADSLMVGPDDVLKSYLTRIIEQGNQVRTEVLERVTIAEILRDGLRLEVSAKAPEAPAPEAPLEAPPVDAARPEQPARPALEVVEGEGGKEGTEERRRARRRPDR
jgi:membrane protein